MRSTDCDRFGFDRGLGSCRLLGSSNDLADANIAEHGKGELVMKLETDGPGLGPGRITWTLGDDLPVETDANEVVPRFDVQAIPFARAVNAGLRRDKRINAAGRVGIGIVVQNLNLVADVGRGAFQRAGEFRMGGVGLADGVMGAGDIADGDAAIAAARNPVFDMEVELIEVARGVKPCLAIEPAVVALLIERP